MHNWLDVSWEGWGTFVCIALERQGLALVESSCCEGWTRARSWGRDPSQAQAQLNPKVGVRKEGQESV